MSDKLNDLVTKRQVIKMLIDDGELKGFDILPRNHTTRHRYCCHCKDCGHDSDDCVCVHNAYLEQILQLPPST